jgi:hypothetical protein
MQTSNSIYGSGLHPLAAPVPAPDEMPTIVPHFTQKAYPYKPRAKTQLFSSTMAAGQRIVFEKAIPGQDLVGVHHRITLRCFAEGNPLVVPPTPRFSLLAMQYHHYARTL